MNTYGPAYNEAIDGERIKKQHNHIKEYMLTAGKSDKWLTLSEIEGALGYPQASISAQLRHLRKEQFGSFIVNKRRRALRGTWEYIVLNPNEAVQIDAFAS